MGKWCNVLFFLTMLANDILTTFLTCNSKENGCGSTQHPEMGKIVIYVGDFKIKIKSPK